MPYTPPSRSPASSAPHSPTLDRRSSYGTKQPNGPSVTSPRPELPRSTSYLTRHRRTTSLKTASFEPSTVPSPPGTTENDHNDNKGVTSSSSLRQSPPPVTDVAGVPAGAVISPPDSNQNSSDDEDSKHSRRRAMKNLAELQAAIRVIEQRRESSPIRAAERISRANQHLTLVMPARADEKSTANRVEEAAKNTLQKISHSGSNTDTNTLIDRNSLSPETPVTASDEDSLTDEDDSERSRRKPPMLRKKSGELVRPALRPSSARRRPSSMPGTPTFSKAVHFDSHLEHVRHFLQVDRPLAVSAGSSPVEAYGSDTEFPFGEETGQTPPFEWEIIQSNFPAETPKRLALPVRVERVFLSADNKTLVGSVAVANLAFNKFVVARFTLDYWKTTSEVVAEFNHDVRKPNHVDGYDRFNFNIRLADQANLEAKTMFFCVKYAVNGTEYWDNNNSTNFQVDFRKKAKAQNGKKGMQGAASRPANSLPRSNKRSPQVKASMMPPKFDDFADGFDSKYKFDLKQPVSDYLGESGTSLRLKGVKSAVNLGSDNLTRRAPQPNGQAFGNRYDFGASLSAAMQAANDVLGDRSGITMKSPTKKGTRKLVSDAEEAYFPLTMKSHQPPSKNPVPVTKPPTPATGGTNSPRPVGASSAIASQSYNDLLDRYCFFGSAKNSPPMKDGTLASGQFDGSNDTGYVLDSADSTANSSPLMMMEKKSPPRVLQASKPTSRSASPAPMTGFVSGTSTGYPYSIHTSFPLHESHNSTAIRG
ncbi:putative phosphatase regulatory subunit-domain-containing protein [Amylocarpus encephaloides]|uniref:Phosphatase regulatory subunit-domain-containing protein n=1 Tax=Amylocarpus encephaloides TaxID=45428 RepID=A0A9P7YBQ0_9HELO|nr:putative phosphatase regulatory subunit-domain-containing protein [Amylocarpus encephaloides]